MTEKIKYKIGDNKEISVEYDEKRIAKITRECFEALIKKQIPKVPCYSGDGYYNGEMVIDTWECPCCGKQYEVDYEDYKYCPNCGQHIDHSTLTEDD